MSTPLAPIPELHSSSLDITALLEYSRLLNSCDDPELIYGNVLLSLMGKLGLGRTAVAIPGTDGGRFTIAHTKGPIGSLCGLSFSWRSAGESGLCSLDRVEDDAQRAQLAEAQLDRVMEVSIGGATLILVLFGSPLSGRDLSSDDLNYALLIGAIAAAALDGTRARTDLRQANRMLERQLHRLRSLFEAGRAFNSLLDRGAILRLLGFTLMGEMAIGRFAVALRDEHGFHTVVNRFPTEIDSGVLQDLAQEGSTFVRSDRTASTAALDAVGVRAAVPMEAPSETMGILLVGPGLQRQMDDEDLAWLSSLANLAASSLENARLLDEMIEKNRLEEDLRIASDIQQGLLPAVLPSLRGYEIAARTIPSQQVGGDCYDAVQLDDGRVLVSIADVSGKGTPASLLMANVQAAVRTLARIEMPLPELVGRINDVIYQNTAVDKFITAFFGVLHAETGRFEYVNAGHNPPFHFSGRDVRRLDNGGLILGVIPTSLPYDSGEVTLKSGDLLVLYTDGVTECLDVNRQEYGDDRLEALIAAEPNAGAEETLERTRHDLLRYSAGAQQSDDITLLVIRRL
jgi:sigma-B regulation protein RsbU (phosphoserine phosphatase)